MELHEHYPERRRSSWMQQDYNYSNPHPQRKSMKEIRENDMKEFSAQFDLAIVFPMEGENHTQQSDVAKHTIYELMEAGLEVFTYLSVQDDELYCLFRAPLSVLQRFADKIDYKMKMDPPTLERTLAAGDPERRILPININGDYKLSPYSPYEHIYLKYSEFIDQKLYFVPYEEQNAFIKSIRLKLLYLLLRAPKREGGCNLELNRLIHKKKILAFYPLHDRGVAQDLLKRIREYTLMPWSVPVEEVKDYFGEKVALYNVFLGHYSVWLILPSIIGLIFQLVVWGTLNFSHPVLPFYSLIITIWSIFMLEYWKREEAKTALRWGMTDFEQLELDRPEFKGDLINSPITGRPMLYYPTAKAVRLVQRSLTVIASFLVCVIGTVAAIYVLRFYLQGRSDTSSASSTIASIINTLQITIFNMIYQQVALQLTNYENHRTDTLYEDSLIIKLFVFQFVNSYASFFFLSFIASNLARPDNVPETYLGQCGATNCMQPLSINLAIIFGTRLTITNILDIFLPYLTYTRKIRAETDGIDPSKKLTPAEEDYMLMPYDIQLQSIQNYADTAVQYGFTLLFITALPIASFFSLVNNYVKVKFTATKLLQFYQRPVPVGVQDIGTWQTIFAIISVAAVITNGGLICFTMDVLWDYSLQGRVWIFLGFQWVLISIQFFTQAIIPDVPEEVELQIQRADFMNDKVLDHVEDEDFDDYDPTHANDGMLEDDEAEKKATHNGWKCLKTPGKVGGGGKIRKDLPDVPVVTYPTNVDLPPKPITLNDPRVVILPNTKDVHMNQVNIVVEEEEDVVTPMGDLKLKNDASPYY